MDLCLVAKGEDYRGFLERSGFAHESKEGEIVTRSGETVGSHAGVANYTVGQRRGLGIAAENPLYVLQLDPERKIPVTWDDKETFSRPIAIKVLTDDREGMLAELSAAFTKNNVNISEANCRADGDGNAVNTFKCGILDLEQLRKVVKALEGVKGVHSVERARTGEYF